MQHSLASTLLPEQRRRILGLLFLRPDEALHGREVARRTGLPPGSAARELNRLADVGLLKRESSGNQQLYRANRQSPVFAELAGILRKTSGLADVLKQALAPAADKLRIAFVYGSMASGSAVAASDIDVMLIGKLGFAEATRLLAASEQLLGREVNPTLFSVAEFKRRAATEAFLQDVLHKSKVFLIGDDDELARITGR
ncbi:MAG: helix-turn-helix domain-containing protein [Pseudomonadota bacterium]|nr:helix-turn-helix domain-containing protein [Burkholderiaceae bacterium]MDQ3445282.1 helix-turn-helix domain-containing protein [Pseudomonadota bacterium]